MYFTADAPAATGSFYFTVATSTNGTLASSNTVNVGTSAGNLTASGYGFGSNAQYTISNVTVSGLTANENSILLDANVTLGIGNITWYNGTGGAGYSVTVTPPGGSAFSDPVTSATVLGNGVTLALGDALAEGDVLNITATGTNPVSSGNDAVDIVVAPGNGTSVTTSSITFGNSVTAVTVSPASTLAGASTTYNVSFKTSSAVPVSGDIFLSETAWADQLHRRLRRRGRRQHSEHALRGERGGAERRFGHHPRGQRPSTPATTSASPWPMSPTRPRPR